VYGVKVCGFSDASEESAGLRMRYAAPPAADAPRTIRGPLCRFSQDMSKV
jgi:hypothetical protein